ncbi:mucin-5AC-like [Synchiropus splendidus]|uniref:mucin-5AC-like n=1 Tax=Synchiropus splendidus TaxID=270530 RepID=UPI00237EB23A|nr:mucin-5AC-like [Synchiropus splendidus]
MPLDWTIPWLVLGLVIGASSSDVLQDVTPTTLVEVYTTPVIEEVSHSGSKLYCSTWGNYHFKTFDGGYFNFPSTCNYVLASECKGYERFYIHLQRQETGGTVSIRSVTIKLDGFLVELFQSAVNVNYETINLPFSKYGVYIDRDDPYITIEAEVGLTIKWNEKDSLWIELTDADLMNQICGLCAVESFNEGYRMSPYSVDTFKIDGSLECEDSSLLSYCERSQRRETCQSVLWGKDSLSCVIFIDINSFINACVEDLCSCNNSDSCLCSTIKEFSRQCAHAGGFPQLSNAFPQCEVRKCPLNMEYKECGSACKDTCSNPRTSDYCAKDCVEGCSCPQGTVLDDITETGCVPVDKCPCLHDGKPKKSGESYTKKCQTCTCFGGEWRCSYKNCPGECTVRGGSHVTTFDGKTYTFHGDCSYILSKDENGTFTISGDLAKCEASALSCLLAVSLHLPQSTKIVVDFKGQVFINNLMYPLPFKMDHVHVFRPSTFYIVVETSHGLMLAVQLTPIMQLSIRAGTSYKRNLQGLCGDFNDIEADDYKNLNGLTEKTAPAFINTWVVRKHCPEAKRKIENPCSLSMDKEKYALESCSSLSDPHGIFAKCHSEIDPEEYEAICIYDTCTCRNSDACMCAAIASYVQACAAEGVSLTGWRDNMCQTYTTRCPSTFVYDYQMTSCGRTCRSLSQPDQTCQVEFTPVDGCGCAEGTYLNEESRCVDASLCPCYMDDIVVKPGQSTRVNGQICSCRDGKLHCSEGPLTKTAVCTLPMVFFNCSNEKFDSKGSECQKTCQSVDTECESSHCVSGCVCPAGLLADNKGGCIKEEQCPCTYNKKLYNPGEQIAVDCNTCICNGKKWNCTTLMCDRTFSVYGDGHFLTFDEKEFHFKGDCSYILCQDFCGGDEVGSFKVLTKGIPTSKIELYLGNKKIEMSEEKVKIINTNNGNETSYHLRPVGKYMVIEAENGLILMWDRKATLMIKLSAAFKGKVCGPCGNFDGNIKNDFTTRNKDIVSDAYTFVNSWKVSPKCPDSVARRHPCTIFSYRMAWAERHCSIIRSQVFADCHSKVSWEGYYEACVKDMCECDPEDRVGFCSVVAAYAAACSEAGACVRWRTPAICPIFCDYYNHEEGCEWHYEPCGKPCMKTCRNPSGMCYNQIPALEGCYPRCPDEKPFLEDVSMQCVSIEQCGCYDDEGRHYGEGEVIPHQQNCHECICSSTNMNCTYNIQECTCKYGGKLYKYNETIYDTHDGNGTCIIAICGENGNIERVIKDCVTSTTERPTTTTFSFSTSEISTTIVTTPRMSTPLTTKLTTTTPTAVPTSSISATTKASTTSQSTTFTGQTTTTKTTERPTTTSTETSQSTTRTTRSSVPTTTTPFGSSTATTSSTPTVTTSTTTKEHTTTSTSTSTTTQCAISCNWSDWINNSTGQGGDGDSELLEEIAKSVPGSCRHPEEIECREVDRKVPFNETGQEVKCDVTFGLICYDKDQVFQILTHKCYDYEIRVKCCFSECLTAPTPTSTTIKSTSTSNPTASTTTKSTTSTGETTTTTKTTERPTTTTTETSQSTTRTTGSSVPTTTTPFGSSTAITSSTPTVTTSTTTKEHTTTSTSTTTQCAISCNWSDWINNSTGQGGDGDAELLEEIAKSVPGSCRHPEEIECREVDRKVPFNETGQEVKCDVTFGLICYDKDQVFQVLTDKCYDYEIRVKCCSSECLTAPTPTSTTIKSTSTSNPTASTTSESTTSTGETTTTTKTTERPTTTTTETSQSTTRATGSSVPTTIRPLTSSTEEATSFTPPTAPVVQNTTSSTPTVTTSTTTKEQTTTSTSTTTEKVSTTSMKASTTPQSTTSTGETTTTTKTTERPTTTTTETSQSTTRTTESSTSKPTSSTTTKSTTSTGETTTTTKTTERPTTTSTETSQSTTRTTGSSVPTTTTPFGSSTAITSSTPTVTTSTTTKEHTTTSTSTSTTTQCAISCNWSDWINNSTGQGGDGDAELLEEIAKSVPGSCRHPEEIECREVDRKVPFNETGQEVKCDVTFGLICYDKDQVFQVLTDKCYDYEIRVKCCSSECLTAPTPTSTTIKSTSTSNPTASTTSESTTSTGETTTTTKTTERPTTTTTETSQSTTRATGSSVPTTIRPLTSSTEEATSFTPPTAPVVQNTTSSTPTVTTSTTTKEQTTTSTSTTTEKVSTTSMKASTTPQSTTSTGETTTTTKTTERPTTTTTETSQSTTRTTESSTSKPTSSTTTKSTTSTGETTTTTKTTERPTTTSTETSQSTTRTTGSSVPTTTTPFGSSTAITSSTPTVTTSTTTKEHTTTSTSTSTTTQCAISCNWSDWINNSTGQGGDGDAELLEEIAKSVPGSCRHPEEIECREVDRKVPFNETGQEVKCDVTFGLICYDKDQVFQVLTDKCYDYEIRVKCCFSECLTAPTPTSTTIKSTSTSNPTASTTSESTTSTGETTTTTKTTERPTTTTTETSQSTTRMTESSTSKPTSSTTTKSTTSTGETTTTTKTTESPTTTSTETSQSTTRATGSSVPTTTTPFGSSTATTSSTPTVTTSTTTKEHTTTSTSTSTSTTTQCAISCNWSDWINNSTGQGGDGDAELLEEIAKSVPGSCRHPEEIECREVDRKVPFNETGQELKCDVTFGLICYDKDQVFQVLTDKCYDYEIRVKCCFSECLTAPTPTSTTIKSTSTSNPTASTTTKSTTSTGETTTTTKTTERPTTTTTETSQSTTRTTESSTSKPTSSTTTKSTTSTGETTTTTKTTESPTTTSTETSQSTTRATGSSVPTTTTPFGSSTATTSSTPTVTTSTTTKEHTTTSTSTSTSTTTQCAISCNWSDWINNSTGQGGDGDAELLEEIAKSVPGSCRHPEEIECREVDRKVPFNETGQELKCDVTFGLICYDKDQVFQVLTDKCYDYEIRVKCCFSECLTAPTPTSTTIKSTSTSNPTASTTTKSTTSTGETTTTTKTTERPTTTSTETSQSTTRTTESSTSKPTSSTTTKSTTSTGETTTTTKTTERPTTTSTETSQSTTRTTGSSVPTTIRPLTSSTEETTSFTPPTAPVVQNTTSSTPTVTTSTTTKEHTTTSTSTTTEKVSTTSMKASTTPQSTTSTGETTTTTKTTERPTTTTTETSQSTTRTTESSTSKPTSSTTTKSTTSTGETTTTTKTTERPTTTSTEASQSTTGTTESSTSKPTSSTTTKSTTSTGETTTTTKTTERPTTTSTETSQSTTRMTGSSVPTTTTPFGSSTATTSSTPTVTTSTTTKEHTTTSTSTTTQCAISCNWSDWINNSTGQGGDGDAELLEEIAKSVPGSCRHPEEIECREVDRKVPFNETGQEVKCDVTFGLICYDKDQVFQILTHKCYDYEIRVKCCFSECLTAPTPTSTTIKSTSTSNPTASTTTKSTTSTGETTTTTKTTERPTTTSTETSQSTTRATGSSVPTTTTPFGSSTATTSSTPTVTTSTTTKEHTTTSTSTSTSTTTQCAISCNWSDWINNSTGQGGDGDAELLEEIAKSVPGSCRHPEEIECREVDRKVPFNETGQELKCDVTFGLICYDKDQVFQVLTDKCYDYEIRVKCCFSECLTAPTPTSTTIKSISTSNPTASTTTKSTTSTGETTTTTKTTERPTTTSTETSQSTTRTTESSTSKPTSSTTTKSTTSTGETTRTTKTTERPTTTSTETSQSTTRTTGSSVPTTTTPFGSSTAITSSTPTVTTSTTTKEHTTTSTSTSTSTTTQCAISCNWSDWINNSTGQGGDGDAELLEEIAKSVPGSCRHPEEIECREVDRKVPFNETGQEVKCDVTFGLICYDKDQVFQVLTDKCYDYEIRVKCCFSECLTAPTPTSTTIKSTSTSNPTASTTTKSTTSTGETTTTTKTTERPTTTSTETSQSTTRTTGSSVPTTTTPFGSSTATTSSTPTVTTSTTTKEHTTTSTSTTTQCAISCNWSDWINNSTGQGGDGDSELLEEIAKSVPGSCRHPEEIECREVDRKVPFNETGQEVKCDVTFGLICYDKDQVFQVLTDKCYDYEIRVKCCFSECLTAPTPTSTTIKSTSTSNPTASTTTKSTTSTGETTTTTKTTERPTTTSTETSQSTTRTTGSSVPTTTTPFGSSTATTSSTPTVTTSTTTKEHTTTSTSTSTSTTTQCAISCNWSDWINNSTGQGGDGDAELLEEIAKSVPGSCRHPEEIECREVDRKVPFNETGQELKCDVTFGLICYDKDQVFQVLTDKCYDYEIRVKCCFSECLTAPTPTSTTIKSTSTSNPTASTTTKSTTSTGETTTTTKTTERPTTTSTETSQSTTRTTGSSVPTTTTPFGSSTAITSSTPTVTTSTTTKEHTTTSTSTSTSTTTQCAISCNWSDWINNSTGQGGDGDAELLEEIAKSVPGSCRHPEEIECREVDRKVPFNETGQEVKCDVTFGLICYDKDQVFQVLTDKCYDYEIRVKCCFSECLTAPTPTSTTIKSTSTSNPTASTTTKSTTSTGETTTTTKTTERPTTTSTETSQSTTRTTGSSVPTTTTPFGSSTATTSSTPTVTTSTTTKEHTTTSTSTTTQCAISCNWSDWINNSTGQGGDGDAELLEEIAKSVPGSCRHPEEIECREVDRKVPFNETGQEVKCDVTFGLICYDKDQVFQVLTDKCYDYEIRVKCCFSECLTAPTPTSTTIKSTSTSNPTASTTTKSTTSTGETTTTTKTTERPTTTSTETSQSTTRTTGSSVPTTTTPFGSSTATTSSTPTVTTSTTTKEHTTTSTSTTTQCAISCNWSDWINNSTGQGGDGDAELLEEIAKSVPGSCRHPEEIECREVDRKVPFNETGQEVKCDVTFGLICYDKDQVFQVLTDKCYDYEIRVKCCLSECFTAPTPTSTTIKSTSTSNPTASTTTKSTTSTGETTTTTKTTERPTTTSTETSQSTTRTTGSSVPTTIRPLTSSTEETTSFTPPTAPVVQNTTSSTPTVTTSTTTKEHTTTSTSTTTEKVSTTSMKASTTPQSTTSTGETTTTTKTTERPTTTTTETSQSTTRTTESSTSKPTSSTTTKSTTSTGETTTTTKTTERPTTTSTETSQSTTGTTGSSVPTTTTPFGSSTATTSSTPTVTTSTTTKEHTTTSTSTSTTTQCAISCNWSDWINNSTGQGGDGDAELLEEIAKSVPGSCRHPEEIECREVDRKVPFNETGQEVKCDVTFGLICYDKDQVFQVLTDKCYDYEIRVKCCFSECLTAPTPTSTTIKSTSTSNPTASTTTKSTTSTGETTTTTKTTERPTTTSTEASQSTTGTTESSTSKPTSSTTTKSTTSTGETTTTTKTTERPTTTSTETSQSTTRTTGSSVPTTTTPFVSSTKEATTSSTLTVTTSLTTIPTTTEETRTTSQTTMKPTYSTTERLTTSEVASTLHSSTPRSTTSCSCVYMGQTFPPGSYIYNKTDEEAWCFTAYCNVDCVVDKHSIPCQSTTAPSSTTVTTATQSCTTTLISICTSPHPPENCSFLVPPRQHGETWKPNKCVTKTCYDGEERTTHVPCGAVTVPRCENGYPPVKVYDEDGCCFHYECQCICSGWGGLHYTTFDGQYYNYQKNCTYVLVQEVAPRYNFSVTIDNENCDARGDAACVKALTVNYKNYEIVLTHGADTKGVLKALVNGTQVIPAYSNKDFSVISTAVKLVLRIPAIHAIVTFKGLFFTIELPPSHFYNNTAGQCGNCDNNASNDCRFPNGGMNASCSDMADHWQIPDKNMTYCATPPPKGPEPCTNKSDLCELLLSKVFDKCHSKIRPEQIYMACQYDTCRMSNTTIGCSSLEMYAELCGEASVCIDWRNATNGTCEYKCPGNKVYNPCIDHDTEPTCNARYNDKLKEQVENSSSSGSKVYFEGCVCPEGTTLFSSRSDLCVTACCTGPDGKPKQPGDSWQSGCQQCVCDGDTMGVECSNLTCSTPEPVICNNEGEVMVTRLVDCCPTLVCECDRSQCSLMTTRCPAGFELQVSFPNDTCCPSHTCVPKGVCVFNNTEFKPGVTFSKSLCESCICTKDQDPVTKLNREVCSPIECHPCGLGYENVPYPGQCCGACNKTSCVFRKPGSQELKILTPSQSWSPEGDNCTVFECAMTDGEITLIESTVSCTFDPENCIPGTEHTDKSGCCPTCIPKSECKPRTNTTYLYINGCKSVDEVEITECEGTCGASSSMYSADSNTMMHSCACCQEISTSLKEVEMNCPDGTKKMHNYTSVDQCGCKAAECATGSDMTGDAKVGRAQREANRQKRRLDKMAERESKREQKEALRENKRKDKSQKSKTRSDQNPNKKNARNESDTKKNLKKNQQNQDQPEGNTQAGRS